MRRFWSGSGKTEPEKEEPQDSLSRSSRFASTHGSPASAVMQADFVSSFSTDNTAIPQHFPSHMTDSERLSARATSRSPEDFPSSNPPSRLSAVERRDDESFRYHSYSESAFISWARDSPQRWSMTSPSPNPHDQLV
eukprot:3934936-Rhodomonas_salina.3